MRKIIGHQNRNLISYKSKYNVDVHFEQQYITDEIFPIHEVTTITIKGKESSVRSVEQEILKYLHGMKVLTVYLMTTDYLYVKNNICQLKSLIDPADLRLRKKEFKTEKEIKHSFYYVHANNRDLVIIGFESELSKGEQIVKEFLLRQNTLEYNYSLCFLCPVYMLNAINDFKSENSNILRAKNVQLRVVDPNYMRRHLNVYIEGKWRDIVEMKTLLYRNFDSNDSKKRYNVNEFQQYAYNQEHKLISKNVRKFSLESNYIVNNWDLISEEIPQYDNFDDSVMREEDNSYPKQFLRTSDRDSFLNYILHLQPGSYSSTFSKTKLDLAKDLIYFVEEAYDTYNIAKKQEMNDLNFVKDENKISQISVNKETSFPELIQSRIEKKIIDEINHVNIIPEGDTSNISINNEIEIKPILQSSVKVFPERERLAEKIIEMVDMKGPNPMFEEIQSTLLNKLNEIRNEGRDSQNLDRLNTGITPVLAPSKPNLNINNLYQMDVKEPSAGRNLAPNNLVSPPNNFDAVSASTPYPDGLNISYNFSNINQMNINISINSFKDFLKNETSNINVNCH